MAIHKHNWKYSHEDYWYYRECEECGEQEATPSYDKWSDWKSKNRGD